MDRPRRDTEDWPVCLFDLLFIQFVFSWFIWYFCDFSIAEFLQTSRIPDVTSSWCELTFRIASQICLETVIGFTRLTSHCGTPNWTEVGLTVSAIVGTARICGTGLYCKRPPVTWYHWSWKPRYPKQYYLRRRIIARRKSILKSAKKSRVKNRYRPYKAKYTKEAREFLKSPNFVDYDFDDVWGGDKTSICV
jgi:hypothetical protein